MAVDRKKVPRPCLDICFHCQAREIFQPIFLHIVFLSFFFSLWSLFTANVSKLDVLEVSYTLLIIYFILFDVLIGWFPLLCLPYHLSVFHQLICYWFPLCIFSSQFLVFFSSYWFSFTFSIFLFFLCISILLSSVSILWSLLGTLSGRLLISIHWR